MTIVLAGWPSLDNPATFDVPKEGYYYCWVDAAGSFCSMGHDGVIHKTAAEDGSSLTAPPGTPKGSIPVWDGEKVAWLQPSPTVGQVLAVTGESLGVGYVTFSGSGGGTGTGGGGGGGGTNPTDPTNPTNPTDPTNPTNPTDPTNPTNPGDGTTGMSGTKVLTYTAAGDNGGLVYYLGTRGGTQSFARPDSLLVVTAPLDGMGKGTAASIIGHAPCDVYTGGAGPEPYFLLRLTGGRTICPTTWTYQTRQGDGDATQLQYTPAGLRLEGSVDGSTWEVIDTRQGLTWTAVNQWAAYNVPATSKNYQALKVVLAGGNQNGSNYFTAGQVDFYGTVVNPA